jgi:hypothetical protein
VAMVGGTTATYATTSPNGTHTRTAKAYDASGNSVSSTPASVVVPDSAAPGDTTVPAKPRSELTRRRVPGGGDPPLITASTLPQGEVLTPRERQ